MASMLVRSAALAEILVKKSAPKVMEIPIILLSVPMGPAKSTDAN